MSKLCCYTADGRTGIHDCLRINMYMLHLLMLQPIYDKSVEYYDNRISHFSAQWGKCAVTGKSFETLSEIHCHHIVPKEHGGTDKYDNLVLITSNVHRLIHAKTHETIEKYRVMLNLSHSQLAAVNALRNKAFLPAIN